jgi:putative SOS response-associated peptidase YedK
MCGRYTVAVMEKLLKQRFNVEKYEGKHIPRYNIAPSQDNPVVLVNEEGKRIMMPMRWGLIPFWAKDEAIGNKMINARIETVAQKPSFRTPFYKRRCLVPADGYYEWRKPGKPGKRSPFRIVLKSRELFAFAGLWEIWKNQIGDIIQSYTIITTEADDLVGKIHPRMPVVLKPENEDTWIDPSVKDLQTLMQLLTPYPSDLVEMYQVSPVVGNPKNDLEECIQPVKGESEKFPG